MMTMDASILYLIVIGVSVLAFVNSMFWFWQWMSERRYQFIGADTREWCLRRMWTSIVLAAVLALAGMAGWWWQV